MPFATQSKSASESGSLDLLSDVAIRRRYHELINALMRRKMQKKYLQQELLDYPDYGEQRTTKMRENIEKLEKEITHLSTELDHTRRLLPLYIVDETERVKAICEASYLNRGT
ncbi:hypothetical protein CPB84DRAFT_1851742 [Gymnopilus junonius]|uniref:Uncharacterized protein n=1 Tax=Gymnopilus junonius TaxID=109634 RepID=A0A9P5NEV4_GYMJU|nr:hypothetical protein CPB84DRAFT_1851742 [Gymnopilus junonius]